MDYSAKYLTFLVLCLVLSEYGADDKYQTNLSRKRRYVVFPEGSTFSVSIAHNRKYNLCNFQFDSKTVLLFMALEIIMFMLSWKNRFSECGKY